jgi:dihydroxyacetone kinase
MLIFSETKWDINPIKIYSSVFETSLNGPGFSITLCNLTIAATELELLNAETKAPSWPNVLANSSTKDDRKQTSIVDIEKQNDISADEDIKGTSVQSYRNIWPC